ncbi:glycosyltransferase [Desulfovibrio sp. OttesenSCG-928-O18]|nr:glycosyltransferase [Desulfovibrio sp. OttesenSCG-928-O18]
MPKVSVLMASYNHERYIEEAVASILAQSFKDFELIVVDDASPDNSVEALRKIRDPRLKLIQHEQNKGVCVTFNDAFAASSGEYIALIGSDDRWHPKKLTTQTEFLDQHPDILAVFSTVRKIDAHGNVLESGGRCDFPQDVDRWKVLRGIFAKLNYLNAPSEMLRRSAIEADPQFYDPRFVQLQDMEQHVRLALRGEIFVMPYPFVDYRWHGENLSKGSAAAHARNDLEYALLMDSLLQIENPAMVKRIIPNSKLDTTDVRLVPFVLAHRALEADNLFQRHWGYTVIGNYIKDPALASYLAETVGFAPTDFYQLYGQVIRRGMP